MIFKLRIRWHIHTASLLLLISESMKHEMGARALGRGSPITLGSLSGHCSIGCMSSSTDYYSLSTKKMLKIVTKKKGGKQLGPSSTHPVAKPDFFICQNCGILKPAARSQFNPTPISERIQFCVNGLPANSFNTLVNLFGVGLKKKGN